MSFFIGYRFYGMIFVVFWLGVLVFYFVFWWSGGVWILWSGALWSVRWMLVWYGGFGGALGGVV
jgi:hypothetical protein